MGKQREDLIGKTGTVTHQITVVDVMVAPDGTVDVMVNDNVGNEYWVEFDGSLSLN
ncbi:hypothetical protein [Paenibacillus wynnii]|uniref:hypothetical protein n=1 Tax=Paenibacillus wynnii TaxID=268407 RepID=UPI000AEBECAD|nr:hypothetical protein [Paenibacillus wynnii]